MDIKLSSIAANVDPDIAATAAAANAEAKVRVAKKTLDQQDFLKLLSVQFQKQDPMKPMDDTAFIAQMAQFTGLEQTSAMSKEISQLRSDTQFATATSLLGRQVTVTDTDDTSVTGTVSGVDQTSSSPALWVNGRSFPLTSLQKIVPAPVAVPVS